uniref:Uncharacterized protein n=1 Tax=Glossina pallidipes TaxID=7398 RepID=A0A1A9Z706_GLOPL
MAKKPPQAILGFASPFRVNDIKIIKKEKGFRDLSKGFNCFILASGPGDVKYLTADLDQLQHFYLLFRL